MEAELDYKGEDDVLFSSSCPQIVLVRLEAELDYKGEDDVLFPCAEIDFAIDNLSSNKSLGIDRINNEIIKKFS